MIPRPLTITPTRFANGRHGAPAALEQLRWSLSSHLLSACLRRRTSAESLIGDGTIWLSAAQALWPEARGIDDPKALKPVLDAKIGRVGALDLRARCVADVAWAIGHIGPGKPVQVGVSMTRHLPDGTRVFGQLPFVLDDEGIWTLVSLDDGGRSRDLARCWAWMAESVPRSPGVRFIRLLDPVRQCVEELWWDAAEAERIEAELVAAVPVLAA